HNPKFDFLGKTRLWVSISLAMLAVSLGYIAKNGLRYGVEFSGGTQLIVKFQAPPSIDRVRSAVDPVAKDAQIQSYDVPARQQVLVRVPSQGEGHLSEHAQAVLKSLASNYNENPVVESSTEIVGPVVGGELRATAVKLTLFGLAFQLLYIAFRFN